jgi:hypothetical protein
MEMLENMAGAVGFAMHEDRLATAARNLRLREAERARPPSRGRIGAACRATLAQALLALATRIAPTVARPDTGTLAPAQ